jgi:hypothetical protein
MPNDAEPYIAAVAEACEPEWTETGTVELDGHSVCFEHRPGLSRMTFTGIPAEGQLAVVPRVVLTLGGEARDAFIRLWTQNEMHAEAHETAASQ